MAAPTAGEVNPVLAANSAIKTAFGASPTFFALGEVGAGHATGGTTAEVGASSVTVDIDLAELSSPGDLILCLYGGDAVGNGVTGVTVSVTDDGSSLLDKSFTSGGAAKSYFSDRAFNFGALATSGQLDLTVTITVASDKAGSGFYGFFIVGDPPPAARSAEGPGRLAQAMAALGSNAGAGGLAPWVSLDARPSASLLAPPALA